ncbi:hypothetical protein NLU13_6360 [Sarocladium strictum]|uniref:Uncharacterized protein n=1 Tax=Sarocladium strictum TaxID=5046 RepID=A0AA39L779_SARSR|nr:hypothetical protein NLU13_6360 [Sarocladium strictum]
MSNSRRKSARRISAVQAAPVKAEDYAIRWQPITNTNTPSADIMSSPDPLNESANDSAFFPPSSTRRIPRSLISNRFASRSVTRSVSPRKQTFELEVGNNTSPQKLLVTVETDDAPPSSVGTRRRLFQSPGSQASVRVRERATTTTVPLRDEDEPTTPRRRGRPRKSNGTPIPGAGVKRRAGTPMQRTPRRARSSRVGDTDDALSEISAQETPRSARRGRPPKNKPIDPPGDAIPVPSSIATASTKRGGRRRRQAMDQDELIQMADLAADNASIEDLQDDPPPLDDQVDLIMAPLPSIEDAGSALPPTTSAAQDSDLWLGTGPDEEVTPRPRRRTTKSASVGSSNQRRESRSASAASSGSKRTPRQSTSRIPIQPEPKLADLENEPADFPDLVAAPSDVSSADDLVPVEPTAYRNDTIAQGEDFSMIFMDSIPSFQASFRQSNNGAPPLPEPEEHEIGEETNMIINNTLETLRQEQEAAEEEEEDQNEAVDGSGLNMPEPEDQVQGAEPPTFDMEVEAEPQLRSPAATTEPEPEPEPEPEMKARHQPQPDASEGLSPVRAFSPLLARSPRKFHSPLRHQVLKATARQAGQLDGSPATRAPAEGESRNSPLRRDAMPVTEDESNMYEDSFSEIPQEVLAAATPRRPTAFGLRPEAEDEPAEDIAEMDEPAQDDEMLDEVDLVGRHRSVESVPQIQVDSAEEPLVGQLQQQQFIASNVSIVSQHEAGRLPTPDDTPPHHESEAGDETDDKSVQASSTSSANPSPVANTFEEVETVTYTASQRRAVQQPTLSIEEPGPAPKVTPMNQNSSPLQEPQSLMPENPQMRPARPTLSPIVRAGRVLQSVTSDPPSPESRERQLGSPFRSSASKESRDSRSSRRISTSPPRPFSFPVPRASSVGAAPAVDDPFKSTLKSTAQSGFLQALGRSIGSGVGHRRSISRESLGSSIRHAPPSEEMSWVADEGPISPRLRGDNSLQDLAPNTLRTVPKEPTPAAQMDRAGEDEVEDEVEPEGTKDKDDETDIWEFEASRTTPRSTRQQPFGRKPPAPILRRGTIPSPWVKPGTSRFAASGREASPELHTNDRDQAVPSSAQQGSENEEFSLLAEQRRAEEERAKANQSPSKGGKFDLSSFFSSPAALPGLIAAKTMSILGTRPATNEAVQVAQVAQVEEVEDEESPRPQRTTEPLNVGQETVASSSPTQETPSITPTQPLYPKLAQKEFQPSSSPRRDLFSPVRQEQRGETPEQTGSESPMTPEQVTMPSVPQKQNFTPRPRQTSQTFFQPSSAQAQPPSGARTPPRMQLSHEDIANWQKQTTTASSDDSPGYRRPLLRPLPHKNASPTKSSLRSPLKPHTPGRVVEFTSSVLSPMEQAQARQHARGSIFGSSLFSQAPPPPQPESQPEDKENHQHQQDQSDVSMTDASPVVKQPVPPPLSQTVWTRQHWLLLDELLQLRRQGPFHGDYEHSARSEKLLGKTVRSQGESMKLERWHLDCVDAFRMEVGDGWDEAVLAKRLFALVLGEERRARGMEDKDDRVMFH